MVETDDTSSRFPFIAVRTGERNNEGIALANGSLAT
jgi:hypothetical protein